MVFQRRMKESRRGKYCMIGDRIWFIPNCPLPVVARLTRRHGILSAESTRTSLLRNCVRSGATSMMGRRGLILWMSGIGGVSTMRRLLGS